MSLALVVLAAAALLTLAYFTYGRLLRRLLRVDPTAPTPAVTMRDGLDYVPLERGSLLSQHFSAIAAAGPIVGPILAGAMFGWLPALVWIVIGAVLIGGVHDFTALMASVRHRARSIAEVVREHMTRRAYLLFLAFIWLALIYVIVAFTDITAGSFLGTITLENGQTVSGGGVATSSLIYLILPILMALALRFTRVKLWMAALIFLPLVGVSIWWGQRYPLDLQVLLGWSQIDAQRLWIVLLVVYCFVASIVPVWLLLQTRGFLGGCFLFAALIGGGLGLMLAGEPIRYPAFRGWTSPAGQPLFPLLFITIACGACSGFHAMIASGTTSKQLRTEGDALPIAYGGMLLEGMVAVVSLCCVMMLAENSTLLTGPRGLQPNFLYANGVGRFLEKLGIPPAFAVSFALLAFTTFVYDTLDVCTRLGRYVIQELTGWTGRGGRWIATAVTSAVPLYLLLSAPLDPSGKAVPTWQVFWNLFGASNQLLAALTLTGVTVWLWQTRRAAWVWFVTGLPAVWMYCVSAWELVRISRAGFKNGLTTNAVPWVAVVLLALAALMLVEAVVIFARPRRRPSANNAPLTA